MLDILKENFLQVFFVSLIVFFCVLKIYFVIRFDLFFEICLLNLYTSLPWRRKKLLFTRK